MSVAATPENSFSWRDLALVMLVSTLAGAAISLSFPLLSLVLSQSGASTAEIGWSSAGHGIGMLLSAPIIATVIGRYGAIKTMCSGLLVTALILLILPIHIHPLSWFFARMIMGAAGAAIFIVTESAVNAMVDDHNRGRVLGFYASFFCIGYASGSLIIAVAGADGWQPFALGALLFLMGLWPALLATGAQRALKATSPKMNYRDFIAAYQCAPLPFIAIFLFGFVEMGLMSLLPVWATNRGLSISDAALLISVWVAGNILLQVPIGWLSDLFSKSLVLGIVALLSVSLIVPLFSMSPGVWWIWPLMLVMGGTLGATYTLSLGLLGATFRGAELTIANTIFIMSLEAGVMLGPALGGMVMITLGADHLLSLWISVLLVLTVLAFQFDRRTGRRTDKKTP